MLKPLHFIHINRVCYEWLESDERKMSQNVLEYLLDIIAITICPICRLVTTYIVCISGKYKIQPDSFFSDNIAV